MNRGLYWISFSGFPGGRPRTREDHLGTVLVMACSFDEAIQLAWFMKINPGGEAVGGAIQNPTAEQQNSANHNRLLSREEAERLRS
jgi:hypothetical protein